MNNMFPGNSTQYFPNSFQPQFSPFQPNPNIQGVGVFKPYELKNPDGSIKGYFWYYGNSVELVFNLNGHITLTQNDYYVTVNQVLETLTLTCSIYDFRHSKIIEFSNAEDAEYRLDLSIGQENEVDGATVTVSIPRDISSMLVKGIYYIDLIATHPSGYCETLFDVDSCIFEVR